MSNAEARVNTTLLATVITVLLATITLGFSGAGVMPPLVTLLPAGTIITTSS
jgi:hypothetical protein